MGPEGGAMGRTFDRAEIIAAMARLRTLIGAGKMMGDILKAARSANDDASMRMAFSLGLELRKLGRPISAVQSVDYDRIDEHRHAIDIKWARTDSKLNLRNT
jgi:hypothetical protein